MVSSEKTYHHFKCPYAKGEKCSGPICKGWNWYTVQKQLYRNKRWQWVDDQIIAKDGSRIGYCGRMKMPSLSQLEGQKDLYQKPRLPTEQETKAFWDQFNKDMCEDPFGGSLFKGLLEACERAKGTDEPL